MNGEALPAGIQLPVVDVARHVGAWSSAAEHAMGIIERSRRRLVVAVVAGALATSGAAVAVYSSIPPGDTSFSISVAHSDEETRPSADPTETVDDATPSPTQEPTVEPTTEPTPGPTASAPSESDEVVTIATLNILNNAGGRRFHSKLSTKQRYAKAAKLINERQPDVVGLQEFENGQYPSFKKAVPGYQIFPKNYKGEDFAGSRPILINTKRMKLIHGSHYYIKRFCDKISKPIVYLRGPSGDMIVANHHNSGNGHESRPCTRNERPYPGKDNDDGGTSRKDAAHALIAAVNKYETSQKQAQIQVPETADIDTITVGDYNSKKTKGSKDVGISADQLPVKILERANFVDAGEVAKQKVNAKYSTVHGSLTKWGTGAVHFDHVFIRSSNAEVLSWHNLVKESRQITDHSYVEVKVRFPKK